MINCLCAFTRHTNDIKNIPLSKLYNDNFYNGVKNELFNFYDSVFTVQFPFGLIQYFVIPFLLLIILILVVSLIVNRYGFEKKKNIKNEINIKTDDFLTEIIFSDHDTKYIKDEIKRFKEEIPFGEKWCKDLILNKIITIKQNINGVNPNRMLLIYKYFGFHHYSKKLIKSRRWDHKLLGIYHYQTLEYKIKTGHIRPHLYDKNKFLKSNALIAVITLSDERFDFLSNYQKKISDADELKILDIIYRKKSELPKKINDWLYNKNSSIVILAIKLMIRYRKALTTSQISYLLSHENTTIRKQTLLAIRSLYVVEAHAILMDHYTKETNKRNKISTLKTFGIIGDHKTKDFACGLLLGEKDLEIKFEIVNCINKIDPSYFENYTIDDPLENDIINRIVLHVNNPYLN